MKWTHINTGGEKLQDSQDLWGSLVLAAHGLEDLHVSLTFPSKLVERRGETDRGAAPLSAVKSSTSYIARPCIA